MFLAVILSYFCQSDLVSATAKGSWQLYWLELLEHLKDVVPTDWLVIVTGDRGLYAKWLDEQIQDNRWHPFLRINPQGQFQPLESAEFLSLDSVVTQIGQSWSGQVSCFKTNPLDCTLLACWDDGYKEPWLIVTDLKPEQADVCWYSRRSWIEPVRSPEFNSGACGQAHSACLWSDAKRDGWKWHQTKMTEPTRAERQWLAIAVATLWLVSVGGEEDATISSNDSCALSSSVAPTRLLSCFRRGFVLLLAHVLNRLPLPMGNLIPQFSGRLSYFSSA